MKSIFEAVDCTDEDMYFTIGLWPKLEDAVKAIGELNDPVDFSDQDHEDYCRVEIRERAIGFSGVGEKKAVLEWETGYNEEEDEYQWKRKAEEDIKGKL